MTRRTDWAEREWAEPEWADWADRGDRAHDTRPGAPEGRGQDPGHGPEHRTEQGYGAEQGYEYGHEAVDAGAGWHGDRPAPASASVPASASASVDEGSDRGGSGHQDAGRGRSRGRGRRRRGFGEASGGASGGAQDGGSTFPSRAGEAEPSGDPAERARAICLRLLTGTPRTRKQLADALRKREIPDDVADEVLSRFEEVGLIDDSAFADAWVESRHHGRGLARRALARELRTKGVDSALIDEAVSQLDSEQEEATARELVARKLRATRGLDRDKRLRRLAGMLARKGYSEGLALRVVRQALEEEGEDTEGLENAGF